MAKKSKSESAPLLIRLEMFPLFDELTDEEAGKVFKAILEYRLYAVIPEFQDRALRTAFNTIKPLIDDDRDKYRETCERNAENGQKGGQAKANNRKNDSVEAADSTQIADTADGGAEKTGLVMYDIPENEMPF